ncbi:L-lysine 6-monooxygenase (NADPH-requiring)-domain-containing protein [Melanogaster broomeanus]|nr:L-lysine 6-monooxygenase (NADPH-requiring)-domain-containing protein [Melanogaster broomeanus]
MASSTSDQPIVYHVIGLGFGPSNLAIAGAFLEKAQGPGSSPISIDKCLFIERHEEFKWHPGMLLAGTRMQISFLKDLATLRSPQSPITFISYLHSQNRLLDFINRGGTVPTRKEYSDYLSWAAQYVQDNGVKVAYGEQVIALDERDTYTIQVHTRVLSTGEHVVRLAKNLIISPGGSPRIPRPLATTSTQGRVIHSSTYLNSVDPLLDSLQSSDPRDRPLRFAVIGSGQSAAEVVIDLHSRLASIPVAGEKTHTLDMIIRNGSLRPSDDSSYVNEIFNPETTSAFFGLSSPSVRQRIRLEYANANYGVVNPRTLESLYEITGYTGALERYTPSAKPKFTILNYSEVLSAEDEQKSGVSHAEALPHDSLGSITLVLQQTLTREVYEKSYDAIFCATGYERRSWLRLLTMSSIGKYFDLDATTLDRARLEVEAGMQERTIDEDIGLAFEFVDNSTDEEHSVTTPSSGTGTPATSPSPEHRAEPTKSLYISRAYQLLPGIQHTQEKLLHARIYLQGVAEETHGLSDTLLSVIGIRAGEVVEDLCAHFATNANCQDAKCLA